MINKKKTQSSETESIIKSYHNFKYDKESLKIGNKNEIKILKNPMT